MLVCIANGNNRVQANITQLQRRLMRLQNGAIKIIALPLFHSATPPAAKGRGEIVEFSTLVLRLCRCCWSIGRCCCWYACLSSSYVMEQQKRPTQQRANAWERSGGGGRLTPLPGVSSSPRFHFFAPGFFLSHPASTPEIHLYPRTFYPFTATNKLVDRYNANS